MLYQHLTEGEREEISRGLAAGETLRGIADRLGRDPGTLSREFRRNGTGFPSGYRAHAAHRRAARRARTPRRERKLLTDPVLWMAVVTDLRKEWSPEEISMRLRREYPQDMTKRVSPETIYATLYILPRGILRRELLSHLRRRHRKRRKRGQLLHDRRERIPHMVSIHERPAEVGDRTIPGHWEGDVLVGRYAQSVLGVLVERTTRLTLLAKPRSRDAADVRRAFARAFQAVPSGLRKTLTYDRGKEMVEHEKLAAQAKIDVFFCDPQAPHQRGTGENTNGLVRQYFPKGTDFSVVTSLDLRFVMDRLNNRPRKVLDFQTPFEVWRAYRRGVALRT